MTEKSDPNAAAAAQPPKLSGRVFLVVVDNSPELGVALRYACVRAKKTGGRVALLWNYRRLDTSAFLRGYEALLRKYCPDYADILDRDLHRRQVEEFFVGRVSLATFDNPQEFDWSGLEGRHLSQSYVPLEGPGFEPMMRELRELFDATQQDGRVVFEHETRVYCGQLSTSPPALSTSGEGAI